MSWIKLCLALGFMAIVLNSKAQDEPVELGAVNWMRDFDQAKARAAKVKKPIFLLFQEVPGCMTCQNYGSHVLGHPLIAEAIETFFVPLVIYNNKGGEDRKVLLAYNEPTWNNPVVRIIDDQGHDILRRHAGDYSAPGLLDLMEKALTEYQVDFPVYLKLIREELEGRGQLKEATFAMFCFWTGEKTYGSLAGVQETEAGFMDGHEVVRIQYNPQVISLEELAEQGTKENCADAYYYSEGRDPSHATGAVGKNQVKKARKFRSDLEPQYYLSHSPYAVIPMSPLQRTKANALLGHGKDPRHLFSPRQLSFMGNEKEDKQYRNVQWEEVLSQRGS